MVSYLPQGRLQKAETQSYVQDPDFPASPRWTALCPARKHLVDLKGNNQERSGHKQHKLVNQVLLPKFLFYTQVVNEYSVHVIQDTEVLHEHIYLFATTVSENKTS